jgi:hypothetical protein
VFFVVQEFSPSETFVLFSLVALDLLVFLPFVQCAFFEKGNFFGNLGNGMLNIFTTSYSAGFYLVLVPVSIGLFVFFLEFFSPQSPIISLYQGEYGTLPAGLLLFILGFYNHITSPIKVFIHAISKRFYIFQQSWIVATNNTKLVYLGATHYIERFAIRTTLWKVSALARMCFGDRFQDSLGSGNSRTFRVLNFLCDGFTNKTGFALLSPGKTVFKTSNFQDYDILDWLETTISRIYYACILVPIKQKAPPMQLMLPFSSHTFGVSGLSVLSQKFS